MSWEENSWNTQLPHDFFVKRFPLFGRIFHKRYIQAPEGILLYRKHALDLGFLISYSMMRT